MAGSGRQHRSRSKASYIQRQSTSDSRETTFKRGSPRTCMQSRYRSNLRSGSRNERDTKPYLINLQPASSVASSTKNRSKIHDLAVFGASVALYCRCTTHLRSNQCRYAGNTKGILTKQATRINNKSIAEKIN